MVGRVAFTSLALCAFSKLVAADALRGVAPDDVERFNGEHFTCDGGVKHPIAVVNDDYCDCVDGTDEPGTNACADSKYYCKNEKHQPKTIYASMVNDKICDCCDGSDEYLTNACEDTCEAAAKEAKQEAIRQANLANQGFIMKINLIKAGLKHRQDLEKQKFELQETIANHPVRQQELETAIQQLEAQVQEEKEAADETADQTVDSATAEPADTEPQAAAASSNEGVGDVEEDFFDDEDADEEEDVAKLQEQLKHMREEAPAQESQPSAPKPPSAAEVALKNAKEELAAFTTQQGEDTKKLAGIVAKLESTNDFGPIGEHFMLFGNCFETKEQNFQYSMCPYQSVTQNPGSISLGNAWEWSGAEDSPYGKYSEMKFTGGTPCWQGPARSSTVRFICGADLKLTNVQEPQKCVYTMDFITPSVCEQVVVEGMDPILPPTAEAENTEGGAETAPTPEQEQQQPPHEEL